MKKTFKLISFLIALTISLSSLTLVSFAAIKPINQDTTEVILSAIDYCDYELKNNEKLVLTKYGSIDSESNPAKASAIASIVVPKLKEDGIRVNDYIWLVYADKKGNPIDAYCSDVTDKSELKINQIIEVTKYDIATKKYERGTIKLGQNRLSNVTYLTLLRDTYKPAVDLDTSRINVVKYDVETDNYIAGTIKTKEHTPNGVDVSYNVLDENTFEKSDYAISKSTKKEISKLIDKTNDVFAYRKDEVSLEPFGRVDSDAYQYALTIAPYVIQNKADYSNKWLIWADTKGNIETVWYELD